ncbi:polymer-forming cytoskeletal protein [Desulfofustis limnaeus]|nr:polymer-forming cytoskeletal protein [Desulfofustis limnaeus]MDX9894140.1 polymer-forming cytoskeletal protein [Desulfofustis sp.]
MEQDRTAADSIIPATMTVVGDITCRGLVRIDGVVQGRIHGQRLVIGSTGRVFGEAELQQLNCFGTFEGRIQVERLHLQASARLQGTIVVEELAVAAGARIDSAVHGREAWLLGRAAVDQVTQGDAMVPATGEGERVSATPGPTNELKGLLAALQRGSRLLVVIDDDEERRACFLGLAKERFSSHYRVVTLLDPRGTVQDLFSRIAAHQGVAVADDVDAVMLGKAVCRELSGTGRGLVLIDNAESMFPATLEGLLRVLAEIPLATAPQVILLGGQELHKIQDLQSLAETLGVPDCLFDLSSTR